MSEETTNTPEEEVAESIDATSEEVTAVAEVEASETNAEETTNTPVAEVAESTDATSEELVAVAEVEASETKAEETTPVAEAEESIEPVAETTASSDGDAPSSIDDLKVGMAIEGTVKRLELYGAFVDLGIGQDALLHISQLGRADVRNIEDVVNVKDKITVYIVKIDKAAGRIALSLEKPPAVTWDSINEGDKINGTVVRIENFGVFIDIGAERPGMVHVSELAEGFVKTPSDVVRMGQEVEVRVLKVNRRKRQIDLTMREEQEDYSAEVLNETAEELPTAMELAFRRARREAQDGNGEQGSSKKDKKRKAQDDIIARTLRSHSN